MKLSDLSELVAPEFFSLLNKYFTVADSDFVTISVAEAGEEKNRGWYRRVFAVNQKNRNQKIDSCFFCCQYLDLVRS